MGTSYIKNGDFIVPVKVNHCHFGSQNGHLYQILVLFYISLSKLMILAVVSDQLSSVALVIKTDATVPFYSIRQLYDIRITCISTKYSDSTWSKFLTLIVTLCNIRKTPIQVKTRQMHETKSGRGYEKKQLLDTNDSKAEVLSLYVVLKFT